jgi:hypothetical protein
MNTSKEFNPIKYALIAIAAQVIFNGLFDLVEFPPSAGAIAYIFGIAPWSVAIVIGTLSYDEINWSESLAFIIVSLVVAALITNIMLSDSLDIFDFKMVFKDYYPHHILTRLLSQYYGKVSLFNVLISLGIGIGLRQNMEN